MENIRYILLVTKDGEHLMFTFRNDELNALIFKRDYFFNKGYVFSVHVVNYLHIDYLYGTF